MYTGRRGLKKKSFKLPPFGRVLTYITLRTAQSAPKKSYSLTFKPNVDQSRSDTADPSKNSQGAEKWFSSPPVHCENE